MPSEQLQTLVEMMRAMPFSDNLLEQRAQMEQFAAGTPLPEWATTTPVDAGGVPAEWVTANDGDGGGVLLHLHGGGYCIGSPATHRRLVAEMARGAGVRALSIDYRLAPEHPFPAAVDDAVAAYRWLLAQGTPPSSIAVAGDSAGGGLTVATLLALRDAGDPLPAAAVCISPWLDLECTGESIVGRADTDPIINAAMLKVMADSYLGGGDCRTPLASPIHAELSGLPPLLVQVGTAEVLMDDALRLADKAKAAGTTVELETWDEMIHVWHLFVDLLPEARQAIERIAEFLRLHMR